MRTQGIWVVAFLRKLKKVLKVDRLGVGWGEGGGGASAKCRRKPARGLKQELISD